MRSPRGTLRSHLDLLIQPAAGSPSVYLAVVAAVLLGFALVRLAWIDAPALDRTAWKEIDYLMISRGYWENGFRFFQPEIWWPAEEPRVTAMELPLVPFLSALLYAVFGFGPLAARFLTLSSFLLMSAYVYRLGRRELGPIVGTSGALLSGFMALRHEFGNFQFSEPPMIALSVVAVFHYAEWLDHRRRRDRVLALCALSLAVALKLTPLYLLIPLAYLLWRRGLARSGAVSSFVVFVALALVLPALWYAWAYHLGTRFMDVFGIFGGHDKMQTLMMLTDVDWYEKMFHRIGYRILTGRAELLVSAMGLVTLLGVRRGRVLVAYLAAILVFFALVAEGQIDAPYRQLTIIPPLSLLVSAGLLTLLALGWSLLERLSPLRPRSGTKVGLSLTLVLLAVLGLYMRRPLAGYDTHSPRSQSKWELAQVVRANTAEQDKLVLAGEYTIHVGGNDLSPVLYHYSGRRGWTLQEGDWELQRVDALVERGATLFVATDMGREPEAAPFLAEVRRSYAVVWEHPESADFAADLTTRVAEIESGAASP